MNESKVEKVVVGMAAFGSPILSEAVAASILYLLLLSSLVVVPPAFAQTTAGVQLEAGIAKEEVDGDLKSAMEIYQKIANDSSAPRDVRSEALLRLAGCDEKLGQQARQVYQQIVRDFADQPAVTQARTRLAEQVQLTLKGHRSGVSSVAWSRDGRRLATGSLDETAKVWDAETGKELLTLSGYRGCVRSVAWSPDGKRLATGSDDKTTKVWDAGTGKELLTLTGSRASVSSVAWSPDGKRLATGSVDRTARVWDAETGKELLSLSVGRGTVLSVAWSPDGKRLATGTLPPPLLTTGANVPLRRMDIDEDAKVWDAETGKELLTLSTRDGFVQSIAWSPDGKRLATGGLGDTKKVWDAETGKELLTLRSPGIVYSMAWSPDGNRLAAGSDWTAKVWDADTGQEVLTLSGHREGVYSVAWSPDGKRLATGSKDNTAKVWDVEVGRESLGQSGHREVPGFTAAAQGTVPAVRPASAQSTAGVQLEGGIEKEEVDGDLKSAMEIYQKIANDSSATRGVRSEALLRLAGCDEKLGRQARQVYQQIVSDFADQPAATQARARLADHVQLTLRGHSGLVRSVAWSPDGKRLATGSNDKTAKVWDAETGKDVLTLNGHNGPVVSVAWSPDGKRLATGSGDKTAKVWDAETGKEVLTLDGHIDSGVSVAWSPDGKRLATWSSENKTVTMWDAETGQEVRTLNGHNGPVVSVAWSPDGKRLATGSRDRTAKVWDTETGKELLSLIGSRGSVLSVAWSQDGKRLATGSVDGTVRVWDAETGKEVLTLSGQLGTVASVAWSPDGKRLASGNANNTANVWDVESGTEVLTLSVGRGTVLSVAWSPDGRQLATGSGDWTTKVWNAETGQDVLALNGQIGTVNSDDIAAHRPPKPSVAWSPDGKRLATGSLDNTAKVWYAEVGTESPAPSVHRAVPGFTAAAQVKAPPSLQSKPAQTVTPSQPEDEYAALLARVKQGDMTVDFRAFRIAGALASGRQASAMALADHAAFLKLLGSVDYQGALESTNQSLIRNYASVAGHYDAMLACKRLQKTEEAALHERLVNALADSIQWSGDGKSPETAWFVVMTPEEDFMLREVMHVTQKSRASVIRDGHAYDRVEVVAPLTNESQSVWFNTDVKMGLYKPANQSVDTVRLNQPREKVAPPMVGGQSLPAFPLATGSHPDGPGVTQVTSDILELQKAIDLDPTLVANYAKLASTYLKTNDVAAAEAILKKAIEKNPQSAEAHVTLGEFYLSQGKSPEAEAEIQLAIGLDPHAAAPRLALAGVYLYSKRMSDAEKVYQDLKVLAPDDRQAYQALGRFYLITGQRDKAVAELQSMVKAKPSDTKAKQLLIETLLDLNRVPEAEALNQEILMTDPAEPHSLLFAGRILINRGQYPEATTALEKAIKADPNSPGTASAYYFLGLAQSVSGSPDLARSSWDHALQVNPNMTEAQLAMARLDLSSGHYDEALSLASEALKRNPNRLLAYLITANASLAKGDTKEGETALQFVLSHDPANVPALTMLTELELKQGKAKEAVASLTPLVQKYPQNPKLHYLLGAAYFGEKDLVKAEAEMKETIALEPQHGQTYSMLAGIHEAQGAMDKAKADLQEGISRAPNGVGNYLSLEDIYEKESNWQEAIKLCEKAHQIDPNNPVAANNLAFLYLEHGGDPSVALTLAQMAKQKLPGLPTVSDTLGWAYYKTGAVDLAITQLEELVRKVPDDPLYEYHLGMAYAAEGHYDRAIQDYDQAIRLKPGLVPAFRGRGDAKFYLGRFPDAAADFRTSLNLNSSDAYTVLWLHLAKKRALQDDAQGFAQQAGQIDSSKWPAPVLSLFFGRSTPEQTLATAANPDSVKDKNQRCEAEFYVGEYLLLRKETPKALAHFRTARDKCPLDFVEYQGAAAEMARLGVGEGSGNQQSLPSVKPETVASPLRPDPGVTQLIGLDRRITDELEGATIGVTHGIRWVRAIGEHGAAFSAADSSRIEYPDMIPREGTLELWIKVDSGYYYSDFVFNANQDHAMIFSTDVGGGDVTWPGTTQLHVLRNGDVSLYIATSKYNRPAALPTEAHGTKFRFGEWHAIGISYGSQGQFIMVDGAVVASAPDKTQTLGSAGNHQFPLDVPTIGETVSHFWAPHRYEGGFEGVVTRVRISPKQQDWDLARSVDK